GFAGACFEFQRSFLGNNLLLFHQTNQMAIGNARCGGFELAGGVTNGLFDSGEVLRGNSTGSLFSKAAGFGELFAGFDSELFELLREFIGAMVGLTHELLMLS